MNTPSQQPARRAVRQALADVLALEPNITESDRRRILRRFMQQASRLSGNDTARPARKRRSPRRAEAAICAGFDPYSFGAVVVLQREGTEALLARLGAIESADQLRQLAEAQHLMVDSGISEPSALRRAILRGAEQRLGERYAAAG
ncbi:MAG: hypothetical protein WC807_15575 [Hyphomicrobium sp.]